MHDLIEAIKAWPVIVQGALGSALFAAVVRIGQYFRIRASKAYSSHSKENRISWLVTEQARLQVVLVDSDEARAAAIGILIYRAVRPAAKAGMWLVYGLMMNSMFSPAGLIGYIICLTYLFRTFDVVRPILDEKPSERLQEISEELKTLGVES